MEEEINNNIKIELVDKNDKDTIEKTKGDIEKLVTVYEKYMYELKENQFNFSDLETMKMPEYLKEMLWQQEKELDIVFEMPKCLITGDAADRISGVFVIVVCAWVDGCFVN